MLPSLLVLWRRSFFAGSGKLQQLATELKGELHYDTTMRTLYATDASAYREMPLAVAIPQTVADLKQLIHFAKREKTFNFS